MEMDFEKICRTCLSSDCPLVSIFENNVTDLSESESSSVIDLLTTLTDIKISNNDGLPCQICSGCADELKRILSFKEICISSQAKLSKALNVKLEGFANNYISDGTSKELSRLTADINYKHLNEKLPDHLHIEPKNLMVEINDATAVKIEYDESILEKNHEIFNDSICIKEEIIQENLVDLNVVSYESSQDDISPKNENEIEIENEWQNELPEIYKCEACLQVLDDRKNLVAHIKLKHTEGLSCKICNKEYKSQKILKLHCSVHAPQQYSCQNCSKTFKQYKYLQRHTLLHMENRPYKCDKCEKRFIGSKELKRHSLSHLDRILNCDICGLNFKTKYNLNAHRSRHVKSRDFKCENCSKGFLTRLELKMHVRVHTGISPYFCSICSKTFTQYSNLKGHNLRFHKIEID